MDWIWLLVGVPVLAVGVAWTAYNVWWNRMFLRRIRDERDAIHGKRGQRQ